MLTFIDSAIMGSTDAEVVAAATVRTGAEAVPEETRCKARANLSK